MIIVGNRCCREESGITLFDVEFSNGVGDPVFGVTIIEKFDSLFNIWMTFSEIQSSAANPSGSGTMTFDCGSSSNFTSGQFRYRVVLRDDNGSSPEKTGDFPADTCS